jgi:hypothetical protein
MNIFLQYLLNHLGLQILLIIWLQESYHFICLLEKKEVIQISASYSWINEELYKTGPDLIIEDVLEKMKYQKY